MTAIKKVLIANRGEIALRVIRTLKAMGIDSVIVHHAADADTPAVLAADETVEIAGEPAVAAYLDIDQIVAAAARVGADAVHPGYGFLSENARFAEALEGAGIRFIGPGPKAIEAMGDKITAKGIAAEAGVSTIPGYSEAIGDAKAAARIAGEIGFPVMLKASAGGGGKGMRIVRSEAEVEEAFTRATGEAQASFGDGRVFLEKYIERPRHIEIQVIADSHGNAIALGERECSIQRRHQKIVEEAPSPFVDEATRTAMQTEAVSLAKAVDYVSAGTVEFIMDADRNFYFLEMNTRLQVEHPVTECITGLDLVREQVRIAAGEPLGYAQEDIRLQGHAIECRICAEDADAGFMPQTGRALVYAEPQGPGVRMDSGLAPGLEVSARFDPMLAKLIVEGGTRAEAIARMRVALGELVVLGVTTNTDYLARILAHTAFADGETHTAFLDEHEADLARPELDEDAKRVLSAAAALGHRSLADPRHAPPAHLAAIGGWRN
jgi:propionyl-CoA carboxylase alpha chain